MRIKECKQRGYTLVEVMVVMGIIAVTIAVGAVINTHTNDVRSSITLLKGSLDLAHSEAQLSDNGATIAFTDHGNGAPGYDIMVCAGRPNTSFITNCKTEDYLPNPIGYTPPGGSAATGPWAIYINSDGSAAAGPWPVPGGTSEPACPAGSSITVNLNSPDYTNPTIDCSTGHLVGLP